MTMTAPQWRELRRIAQGSDDDTMPGAGWFGTVPERALAAKGLVKPFDHESALGGRGPLAYARVKWHCVRLTPAGRKLLKESPNHG